MRIKYDQGQKELVKTIVQLSQMFSEQIHGLMKKNRMGEVKGTKLFLCICPNELAGHDSIWFGEEDGDAGFLYIVRREFENNEWHFDHDERNSPEYEKLLSGETDGNGNQESAGSEKELPPDGLWISDYSDHDPVDCGVSVDDGLAES